MNEIVFLWAPVLLMLGALVFFLIRWRDRPERDIRRPEIILRRPRVLPDVLAPLTFVEPEELNGTARKASGIFVVMKPELIEQLAIIAKDRRVSRSALCRALILRALEAEVKS